MVPADVGVREQEARMTDPAARTALAAVFDLDALLAQLRAAGADVAAETQDMDGVGRFGWVTDPEGNRVELWQPA